MGRLFGGLFIHLLICPHIHPPTKTSLDIRLYPSAPLTKTSLYPSAPPTKTSLDTVLHLHAPLTKTSLDISSTSLPHSLRHHLIYSSTFVSHPLRHHSTLLPHTPTVAMTCKGQEVKVVFCLGWNIQAANISTNKKYKYLFMKTGQCANIHTYIYIYTHTQLQVFINSIPLTTCLSATKVNVIKIINVY